MSTTTNLRTTSRRRTLLTAGVLAAIVTAAGAGAAPAHAALPFDGGQVNAVLTSATFQLADVLYSIDQLKLPDSHRLPLEKNIKTGAAQG